MAVFYILAQLKVVKNSLVHLYRNSLAGLIDLYMELLIDVLDSHK